MQMRPVWSSLPRRFRPLAAVAAIGVAVGLLWLLASPSSNRGQAPMAPPVTVSAPLARQVVDWNDFSGQFTPIDYVEIRTRVGGYLTELHFTDGQVVAKGDLLFVIDPRPYEIALASARAKLSQAGSSQTFTKRQLGRAEELRQKDYVAQSVLDQREDESKGAGAGVVAARAAVRDAELNLEFTHVVAPVAGRIGARQVSLGNLVAAGGGNGVGTLLTTIVSLDPIWFTFDISEADYLAFQRHIRGGSTAVAAEIRLPDETGWPHKGRIDFIDNQIDRSSGTIRVRAVLDNADHAVTPGTFGRVRIAISDPYDALLIPDAAILTDQSRKIVLTVAEDGTVIPKPIVAGAEQADGLRVVREGLGPADRVIINGLLRARPGAKVTPQPGTIGNPG